MRLKRMFSRFASLHFLRKLDSYVRALASRVSPRVLGLLPRECSHSLGPAVAVLSRPRVSGSVEEVWSLDNS